MRREKLNEALGIIAEVHPEVEHGEPMYDPGNQLFRVSVALKPGERINLVVEDRAFVKRSAGDLAKSLIATYLPGE